MNREKLMCEVADGNWNPRKNQCEFDDTSDHIDCMKTTVKGAIEGGMVTGMPEGVAVKGTKELIQCYGEKAIYQKIYEKLEVSDRGSEKFTEERTHIQVENVRKNAVDRRREQVLEEKNFVSDVEDFSQPTFGQSQEINCSKCGSKMQNKAGSVYVCPDCGSKFVEN